MAAPCYFFARGGCRRGSSCRYAHEIPLTNNPFLSGHELRGNATTLGPITSSVLQATTHPLYAPTAKKPSCRFFLQGACKKGILCRFSHDETVEQQPTTVEASIGKLDLTSNNISIDEVATQVCLYMILQK